MTFDAELSSRAAPFAEPRRHTLEINPPTGAAALAAIEFGDPTRPLDVVFLHANGFNAATYRSVLGPLSDQLRILAVDQQGHGRSAQRASAQGRRNWTDLRDDLVALLDVLPGGPFVLAGHSLGGAASLFAAALRPERVKGLALFDPVLLGRETMADILAGKGPDFENGPMVLGARRRRSVFPSREAAVDSYRGRGAFNTWPEESLLDYAVDGFRERADGDVELACAPEWEASNFASHALDPWPVMGRIEVPVVVLRAETGSTCHLLDRSPFPADNTRVRVEVIPGTTHFLPIERPDVVRASLLELTR